MTTASDLRSLWSSIATPPRGSLAGRRVLVADPERRFWASIDSSGTRQLLVAVPPGTQAVTLGRTRGLEALVDEMRVGSEAPATYLALACVDRELVETFAALCADVVEALEDGSCPVVATVEGIIARWRRFWERPHAPLSREECLGLFAELWFLDRWLVLPGSLAFWTGPSGSRHDFQSPEVSVEVKATSVTTVTRHRIASLEQLEEPETGMLYLFSLQVAPDDLAANTLPALCDRIRAVLAGTPGDLETFMQRLSERGFNPAHAEHYRYAWRVLAEGLFRVEEGFPRITRRSFGGGMPDGVHEVAYSLDLSACAPWRVASRPDDAATIVGPLRTS